MEVHAFDRTSQQTYQPQATIPTYNRGKPKKKGKTLAAVLLITAAGVGVWYIWGTSAATPSAATPPAITVSTPLQKDLEPRSQFLGQFAPVEQVELRAQVGGTLSEIHFKDGDIVHKGDLLFVIDPTPYDIKFSQASAQLESASAKLQLANQELARAKILKKTDAGSTQSVEQRFADQKAAQASLDEAKAMVRDAKFDLDRTRIKSPFSGRIGTHMVSVGNLISGSRAGTGPTTLLTTVVSLDPIYLNFDMSEADYIAFNREKAKVKGPLADKVSVALSDENTFGHQGTLNFIDNVIDRSSGTMHARATIPNKDLMLTPGGFGRVRLASSAPVSVLLVPDSSVLPDQSNHIVLTLDKDNVVTPKPVEIGELRGGLRVIRSGLDANDKVIIEGITSVAPGAKTTPTDGKIEFKNDAE